jgi:hypothetical protein
VVVRLAMRAVAAHSPEAGTKQRNPPYYLDAATVNARTVKRKLGRHRVHAESGWEALTATSKAGGGAAVAEVALLWNGSRERESRVGRGLKARPGHGGGREPVQVHCFRPAV